MNISLFNSVEFSKRHNSITPKEEQEILEQKIDSTNSTAIAGMMIGSLALLITLIHLAVS